MIIRGVEAAAARTIFHLPPDLPGRLSPDNSSLPPGFRQGMRPSVSLPLRVQPQAIKRLSHSRARARQHQECFIVHAIIQPLWLWCRPTEQGTQKTSAFATPAFAMWVAKSLNRIRDHCFFTSQNPSALLATIPMLSLLPARSTH